MFVCEFQLAEAICTAAHKYDGAILDPHGLVAWAFENGYYSYHDTIDDDGNLLDSVKVISRKDLQDLANIFAPGFDVINF